MSRIYFHTKQSRFEIFGAERARCHMLCQNIYLGVMREYFEGSFQYEILKKLYHACSKNSKFRYLSKEINKFLLNEKYWHELYRDLKCFFSVHIDDIYIEEKVFNLFYLPLNTAYILGSDSIKLAARIHGQCELHGWIDGPNKAWIANIIERSLEEGIYRQGMGWDSILELLRQDAIEPVVMSYSVCDSFPTPEVSNFPYDLDKYDEPDYSKWEALSKDEQWDIAFAALKESGQGLELNPDSWDDFYFGETKDNAFTFGKALSKIAP